MRSTLRTVLPIVFVILLFYFINRPRTNLPAAPEPTPPAPPVAAAPQASPSPVAAAPEPIELAKPAAELIAAPAPPPKTMPKGEKLPPGPPRTPPHALSFRREGRLIVVFGDILYGKLPDGEKDKEGFVRVHPLNPWGSTPVAYSISKELKNPERVQRAIELFRQKTPVRFVPYKDQADAIVFQPGEKNCRSYLGKIGGHQPIFLDDACDTREVCHEILHALGFIHEHSRPDRDRFLKINWEKIDPENRAQFEVAPEEITSVSTSRPFDYKSIMLYDSTLFAKTPGERTLESTTGEAIEPSSECLSDEDIVRLYKVYGP